MARALLIILDSLNIPVSDDIQWRILFCKDRALLERWAIRAVTPRSAEEIVADR